MSSFIDYREHWRWNVLFALIYALFLDRWIKDALLDEAPTCDEIDALRRSNDRARFVAWPLLVRAGLAIGGALPTSGSRRSASVLPHVVIWALDGDDAARAAAAGHRRPASGWASAKRWRPAWPCSALLCR